MKQIKTCDTFRHGFGGPSAGSQFRFCVSDSALVRKMLNKKVTLDVYVDSRTVFDVIVKDGRISGGILQIYIHDLRQSFATGELKQLA